MLVPFRPLTPILRDLDQLHFSQYLAVVTDMGGFPSLSRQGRPNISKGSSAAGILEDLRARFRRPLARDRNFAEDLALDLALSSRVVFSENLRPASARSARKITPPETPDDAFAQAAGMLSLREQDSPPIAFSLLAPRSRAVSADSQDIASPLRGDDPEHHVQGETARSLIAEWEISTDPRTYEWKGWREGSQTDPTEFAAFGPVRPLSPPRLTQTARPNAPSNPPSYRTKASVPIILPLPPAFARSSPVPDPPEGSYEASLAGPSTQLERGPHGGRPAVGGGKKKVKKRVGGF